MNYEVYKEIVKLVAPYLTIIVGLLVTIAKLHLKKIEKQIKEDREKSEKENEKQCLKWDKQLKNILSIFNTGIKTERKFTHEVLNRHEKNINKLFNIKVSKEFCKERHKIR